MDGGLEVGGVGMDLWLGGLQVRLHGQCHLCLILAAVQLGYRKLITFSCATSECVPLWSAGFRYGFDFLEETVFL